MMAMVGPGVALNGSMLDLSKALKAPKAQKVILVPKVLKVLEEILVPKALKA